MQMVGMIVREHTRDIITQQRDFQRKFLLRKILEEPRSRSWREGGPRGSLHREQKGKAMGVGRSPRHARSGTEIDWKDPGGFLWHEGICS